MGFPRSGAPSRNSCWLGETGVVSSRLSFSPPESREGLVPLHLPPSFSEDVLQVQFLFLC